MHLTYRGEERRPDHEIIKVSVMPPDVTSGGAPLIILVFFNILQEGHIPVRKPPVGTAYTPLFYSFCRRLYLNLISPQSVSLVNPKFIKLCLAYLINTYFPPVGCVPPEQSHSSRPGGTQCKQIAASQRAHSLCSV